MAQPSPIKPFFGQLQSSGQLQAFRRPRGVGHAGNHRGLGMLGQGVEWAEHRQAVQDGAVAAGVVVQRADRMPSTRVGAHGREHLPGQPTGSE